MSTVLPWICPRLARSCARPSANANVLSVAGKALAQHAQLRIDTGLQIWLAAPAQLLDNEAPTTTPTGAGLAGWPTPDSGRPGPPGAGHVLSGVLADPRAQRRPGDPELRTTVSAHSKGSASLRRTLADHAFTNADDLITAARRGLRQLQHRSDALDGCLAGTGLLVRRQAGRWPCATDPAG